MAMGKLKRPPIGITPKWVWEMEMRKERAEALIETIQRKGKRV